MPSWLTIDGKIPFTGEIVEIVGLELHQEIYSDEKKRLLKNGDIVQIISTHGTPTTTEYILIFSNKPTMSFFNIPEGIYPSRVKLVEKQKTEEKKSEPECKCSNTLNGHMPGCYWDNYYEKHRTF